jgi:hypothetical protein
MNNMRKYESKGVCFMDDKILEFNVSGCIYTGEKDVTLDELMGEFLDFCDSKGWEFCGIATPLSAELTQGDS